VTLLEEHPTATLEYITLAYRVFFFLIANKYINKKFFTDVSGQPIGPIFKVQEVQENFLALEDWADKSTRNVGTDLPLYAA
jgi:hypothetical protein